MIDNLIGGYEVITDAAVAPAMRLIKGRIRGPSRFADWADLDVIGLNISTESASHNIFHLTYFSFLADPTSKVLQIRPF
jgi:hypothetical protein